MHESYDFSISITWKDWNIKSWNLINLNSLSLVFPFRQIGDKFKKILKTDDAFKSIDAVMTGKMCSEEMDSVRVVLI